METLTSLWGETETTSSDSLCATFCCQAANLPQTCCSLLSFSFSLSMSVLLCHHQNICSHLADISTNVRHKFLSWGACNLLVLQEIFLLDYGKLTRRMLAAHVYLYIVPGKGDRMGYIFSEFLTHVVWHLPCMENVEIASVRVTMIGGKNSVKKWGQRNVCLGWPSWGGNGHITE